MYKHIYNTFTLKKLNNFQISLDNFLYFNQNNFPTMMNLNMIIKILIYFYQQFFIQYQNVMRKVHDHTKKNSKKIKTKIKSKSKSKDKYMEFDQSFLNALIELKNMEGHCKKKYNKHDRKTVSIYIPQPNVKRPKSSFQRHFHSTKLGNINPLKINIQKAVTEQDNISFTQITPRLNEEQQRKQKTQKESFHSIYQYPFKPNYQRSAIIIQRAWRNYQTYKVISKYNHYFKGLTFKNKKEKKQQSRQQNDLEKTSKPKHKRTPAQVTSQLREYLDSETGTIPLKTKQYAQKNSINKTKPFKEDTSPIIMFDNRTQSQQDQKSKIIKTVSPFEQILSQKQKMKFSKHHSDRVKQLQQQQHQQKLMKMIERIQYQLKQNQLEETVQKLLKKSEEQQKQFLRRELVNSPCSSQQQPQEEDKKSFLSIEWQTPQQKILQARKRLLQDKRQTAIFKLQRQFTSSRITKEQYQNKRDYVFAKYEEQLNKIAKSKKQMQKYYQIINNQTIQFYKETIQQNKSTKDLIRKTFSAQSIILKCIMKDITLKNFQPPEIKDMEDSLIVVLQPPIKDERICLDLQTSEKIQRDQQQENEQLRKQSKYQPNQQKNLLQVFDRMMDSQSISQNSLVDISQSGLVMIEDNEQQRQKKQKIPDLIKQQLIEEIVMDIFIKDKIYERFRPYIETGIQFHRIEDHQIGNFLTDIQEFFPTKSTLKLRLNQKINPSSLEILKIIRNCDYDVEEYQLILDQQCFKRYKRIVEKKFDDKIASKLAKIKSTSSITDFRLKQKMEEKRLIKIQKIKKYTAFQRDLFVMYMKAVFNCFNELLIEAKSFSTFMNSRSSIGPGQLTLAMKQYNKECPESDIPGIIQSCMKRINSIVHYKIDIPSHLNRNQMDIFQRQIMKQISIQLQQNEYKWVNYMDETLQIWLDLALLLQKEIINQVVNDIYILL